MFGGELIGEVAFTKKHLWMSSKDIYTGQNSSGSIWDMFRTIATIPVEPQGVVQFRSTKKILERTEFIDKTKRMFHKTVNGDGPAISSSSNGLIASLISSENSYFAGGSGGGLFQLDLLRLFHQFPSLSVHNLETFSLIIIISLLTMVEILSSSIYSHVNIFWRFMLCLYVPWVHLRGRNR